MDLSVESVPIQHLQLPPSEPATNPVFNPIDRIRTMRPDVAGTYATDREMLMKHLDITVDPSMRPDTHTVRSRNEHIVSALDYAVLRLTQQTNPADTLARYQGLFDIARFGKVGDHVLIDTLPIEGTQLCFRNSLRSAALILSIDHPDVLSAIARHEIIGGHKSQSGAIPGVLTHGLRPQNYLNQRNILMTSGWADQGSYGISRTHVSFFYWFKTFEEPFSDTPLTPEAVREKITGLVETSRRYFPYMTLDELRESPHYARKIHMWEEIETFLLKPNKTPKEQEHEAFIRANFPVTFLMSCRNVDPDLINGNRSHRFIDDFYVFGGIERDNLLMFVPSKHIPMVQRFAESHNSAIPIYPLESLVFLQEKSSQGRNIV